MFTTSVHPLYRLFPLLVALMAFGCSEASTGLPNALTDGDIVVADGDDTEVDGVETDGDAEPEKDIDEDGDIDIEGVDIELPDLEPVDGDLEETGDDDGETEPAEEEHVCLCDEIDDCCDGCMPLNEGGTCGDDGFGCTIDACAQGVCRHTLAIGYCLIDEACFEHTAENPDNICQICNTIRDPEAWSPAEDGLICDDGNDETTGDACRGGQCAGVDPNCQCGGDDACCDGCYFINEGLDCDPDGLYCTDDLCQSGFCRHTIAAEYCLLDGTCYSGNDENPDNSCETCDSANPGQWSPRADDSACDDGDLCTTGDACQSGVCVSGDAVTCPDAPVCRLAGVCDENSGMCEYAPADNGTACDDGNDQTDNDACTDGQCLGEGCTCSGVNECCDGCQIINDGNPCAADGLHCTADVCDAGVCTHVAAGDVCIIDGACVAAGATAPANECMVCAPTILATGWSPAEPGAACEDGNLCSTGDTCQTGLCTPGDEVVCGAPDQCHRAAECMPATGMCEYGVLPDDTPCDDGNTETGGDRCVSGVCLGQGCECNTVDDCCDGCFAINNGGGCMDDGISCTTDTCALGQCLHNITNGYCRIDETCYIDGAADPDNQCRFCASDSDTGAWTDRDDQTACDDGDLCTGGDQCIQGQCTGGDAVSCVEPPQCGLAGECDPTTGLCAYADAPEGTPCDDGNSQTLNDACSGGVCLGEGCQCSGINDCCDGCAVINDGGSCADDNLACTADVCNAGVCLHQLAANTCLIGDACIDTDAPNPLNACERCDPQQATDRWSDAADGIICDDGNACTATDTCNSGACTGGDPVTCTAAGICYDVGVCDPATGQCSTPLKPEGSLCDDGDPCTTGDACHLDLCSGTAKSCAAQDDCHGDGVCDPTTGQCNNPMLPDDTICDIGNACYVSGACSNGVCEPDVALDCDDNNPCTADTCDPLGTDFCVHTNLTGTACDDGNACTTGDICTDGVCDAGTATDCGDDNLCTEDICDPTTGQCSNPPIADGGACDDQDLCTTGDQCNGGVCSGTAIACTEQQQCHVSPGTCDGGTGQCSYDFAAPDTACDDGNPATGGDHCDGAGHCVGENCSCSGVNACCDGCLPLNEGGVCADDGLACTVETCREGFCDHSLTDDFCLIGSVCVAAGAPNPGNPCEACQPALGTDAYTPLAEGSACDDGQWCNGADTCDSAGACIHEFAGNVPAVCNDDNACTADSCTETEHCVNTGLTGTACDDTLWCNGMDFCQDGACSVHSFPWNEGETGRCGTAEADCSVYVCNEADETCDTAPAADGTACSDDGLSCTENICSEGVCTHPVGEGVCLIDGQCYPSGYTNAANYCQWCRPLVTNDAWSDKPETMTCPDDGFACTTDHCDGAGVCLHDIGDASCLIGGICYDSDAPNPSNECQWCVPLATQDAWSDKPVTAACTSDGFDCTTDHCDGHGVCLNELAGTSCLINDACFGNGDTDPSNDCRYCQTAVSQSQWTMVPAGNACTEDGYACTVDSCDGLGTCLHPVDSGMCAIDNACWTDGTPNPANPCEICSIADSQTVWTPLPDNTSCDDGLFCTGTDTCLAGLCLHEFAEGMPPDCIDDNQCSADTCLETSGGYTCSNDIAAMDGETCDDGNRCTDSDICDGGTCFGVAVLCDDGDQCTADWCDIGDGQCKTSALPDDTPCTADDDMCTWDSCQSGICVAEAPDCDDANPCTGDSCDASTGLCVNAPITGEHECDGNLCTQDRCIAGTCMPAGIGETRCGEAFTSQANDNYLQDMSCIDEQCDPATGQCVTGGVQAGNNLPILCSNGTQSACQDGPGDLDGCCTLQNTWAGTTCCGSPQPPSLRDDPRWTGCCVREDMGPVSRWVRNPNGICEDDGLACTTESCSDGGTCLHRIANNWCVIDNQCIRRGAVNPDNTCEICTPNNDNPESQVTWSARGYGESCDDGLACTASDRCVPNDDGTHIFCTGTPVTAEVWCDDGNQCTRDLCSEPRGGCYYEDMPDFEPCDDGDTATVNDVCMQGQCTHADLTADGFPDIVTGSGELFPGSSSMSYDQAPMELTTPGACTGVAVADFNRDGYNDVILTCLDQTVFVSFGPAFFISAPVTTTILSLRVCSADIDGNGYPDIVLPGINGDSQVHFNIDGTGTTSMRTLPTGEEAMGCAIADFNGDGKLDVAISRLYGDNGASALTNATVFYQQADSGGNPDFATVHPPRIWVLGGYDMAAGQLDPALKGLRDTGFIDLVASFSGAPFSAIVHDAGVNATVRTRLQAGQPNRGVALADFNGDGVYDILFAGAQGNPSFIWEGDIPVGMYTASMSLPVMTGNAFGTDTGDLNNDGNVDACFADMTGGGYVFGPGFTALQSLQDTPVTDYDIAVAGGAEKIRRPGSACQCGAQTPTVCCDGCMPANEGRWCTSGHDRICRAGYCMPLTP